MTRTIAIAAVASLYLLGLACVLAGIWTGDERWVQTGATLFISTLLVAVAAMVVASITDEDGPYDY